MEESSRRTQDEKFIVESKDRAMNRILLIYLEKKVKVVPLAKAEAQGRGEREDLELQVQPVTC
jgi:hypothetical protein